MATDSPVELVGQRRKSLAPCKTFGAGALRAGAGRALEAGGTNHEMSCTLQDLAVVFLLFLGAATPAGAAPEQNTRTVTWFADRPQERARVQLACLDDPGHVGRSPDCINAHQASVTVALRQARARGVVLSPTSPAYWSADPEARRAKLMMCRRNPELANCDTARRSLRIEAGLVGR